ncbi:unnamed protein product, partial [Ectocarpus sp. 6 AP-2014]
FFFVVVVGTVILLPFSSVPAPLATFVFLWLSIRPRQRRGLSAPIKFSLLLLILQLSSVRGQRWGGETQRADNPPAAAPSNLSATTNPPAPQSHAALPAPRTGRQRFWRLHPNIIRHIVVVVVITTRRPHLRS